jgi:Xaa-Pro aminopeptidase
MFTHIKYAERLARIREALKLRKIDCLVGTRLKTITHVSGAFVPWRSVAVIPAESEPRLITLMLDAERVRDDSWLSIVIPYGPIAGGGFVESICNQISDLGLEKGTIGIESGSSSYLPEGYITLAEYEELRHRLPEANLVNATDVFDQLTLIKEDEEVKLMRQATAICDTAHEAVLRELRVGMTEKQIAGIAEKAARDAGSEFAWTFTGGMEIASGYRTAYAMGGCTPATDKIIQCGDAVLLDIHAMYGLMLGDVSHNVFVGRPTAKQKEIAKAYVETCHTLIDAMKPGITLGEVAQKVTAFVAKNNWEDVVLPGYGHGIGHFGHEWYPCVAEYPQEGHTEPEFELRPNYIQMIAVVANRPGIAGFRLERPLLITETGNEILSSMPIEPAVLDRDCVCRK